MPITSVAFPTPVPRAGSAWVTSNPRSHPLAEYFNNGIIIFQTSESFNMRMPQYTENSACEASDVS